MFNSELIKFPSLLSNIFKGGTTGRALGGSLLRFIFSIPGRVIDQLLGIINPNHLNLSENFLTDFNNNRLHPFTAIFGFCGDIIGIPIGWIVGITIGLVLYAPDAIIVSIINLIRKGYAGLVAFEAFCRQEDGPKDITFFTGDDFFSFFANTGALLLGLPIAFLPFLVCKFVEFMIPPTKDIFSLTCLSVGGFIGSAIGLVATVPIVPVLYVVDKITVLYERLRNMLRSGVALVYAKTNMWVLNDTDYSVDITNIHGDQTNYVPEFSRSYSKEFIEKNIHSTEFKNDVDDMKSFTWGQLICSVFAKTGETEASIILGGANGQIPVASAVVTQKNDPVTTVALLVGVEPSAPPDNNRTEDNRTANRLN